MTPKLRKVQRHAPLYPLNKFPKGFGMKLGKELVYLLATRDAPDISGDDWEKIFARCIGVNWKKSNEGLEDVVMGATSWSAKTIKNPKPFTHEHIRLISGRNSVDYSFDVKNVHAEDPDKIGSMVLGIWNARYEKVMDQFSDLRTVILLRDASLTEFAVLEIATQMFDAKKYKWDWNGNNNLEGYEIATNAHRFTWQPHGSQFTYVPQIPDKRLKLRIKRPPQVDQGFVLEKIKFDPSWVEIVK